VFLVVFLFLRTFAVEPFGVPTGSMAPTLIGNHRAGACPRCGYPVRVGLPTTGDGAGRFANVPCPNCGKPVNLTQAPDMNGDRLLVDKNVYHLRRPRRWEVAVFHCVADPSKPYVKRIVGLPGEVITIVDGDVYAHGQLVRKSLREAREARVPVFDLNYPPLGGWGPRWLVYPPDADPRLPADAGRPPTPADSTVLVGGTLVLDAAATAHVVGVEYRHWNLDETQPDLAEQPIESRNSYDGPGRSASNVYPVHDFMLDCEVEVPAGATDGSLTCRLFDGADSVTAEVPVGPKSPGSTFLTHDQIGVLASAHGFRLEPGKTYRVEFAFVDRRATLAVNGKVVVSPADLPPEPRRADPKAGKVTRPLYLGARGCRLVVHNLRIFRDVHYTQAGRHGTKEPARLGRTEYFLLGDNSGNSQDSREWPHPGVPEGDFIGKPFLIHQPLRLARVTVGGRERAFQTLDWSRLRWLH
jgi:signal peptidase I